jgi:hypothetical protein
MNIPHCLPSEDEIFVLRLLQRQSTEHDTMIQCSRAYYGHLHVSSAILDGLHRCPQGPCEEVRNRNLIRISNYILATQGSTGTYEWARECTALF